MAAVTWNVSPMGLQLVQVVCALGIVVAYALLQLGRTRARGAAFLATNLVCAAGMGVTAVLDFQPGFVITNSFVGGHLGGRTRSRRSRPARFWVGSGSAAAVRRSPNAPPLQRRSLALEGGARKSAADRQT